MCGLIKILQNIFCYKELQIKFCFMHNTKYISHTDPLFYNLLNPLWDNKNPEEQEIFHGDF